MLQGGPAVPAFFSIMNKDALLATLIGFGIGLCITGIFLLGPSVIKSMPKLSLPRISLPQQKSNNPITPTPAPEKQFITIDSPLPDALEAANDLLVSGTTNRNATVVVQGTANEDVVATKDDGKYAGNITLAEGKNDITATSYLGGTPVSQTVTVYFTEEKY